MARPHDAEANHELCRKSRAEPRIGRHGQPHGSGLGKRRRPVKRTNTWLLGTKRLDLYHDRLGYIVERLLQAACPLLVAPRLTREL